MLKTVVNKRFRGFLPVVVDVETGGFDADKDALLEIAAVLLDYDDELGWQRVSTVARHVEPPPAAGAGVYVRRHVLRCSARAPRGT